MRILVLLFLFVFLTAEKFPKYRAWENATGNVSVRSYAERERLQGETDEQLMDRLDAASGKPSSGFITIDANDVAALASINNDRHKWRIQGGKIKVDPSIPDTQEIINQKEKEKAKQDLKNAVTVNDLKVVLEKILDVK